MVPHDELTAVNDMAEESAFMLLEQRDSEEGLAAVLEHSNQQDDEIVTDDLHALNSVWQEIGARRSAITSDTSVDVAAHEGEMITVFDIQIEIETGDILNTSSMFMVDGDGTLKRAASIDTANARYWHTPSNEREFSMSPQRDLWWTAKELKWDKYISLQMFTWVPISSVNQKVNRIYSTLWAYKIKFEDGLKFLKLNPRWCLKGGTMDREKFKSHQETLRMTSYRIILALKGGYWHAFCDFLLDCSDAFQSTRTDGAGCENQAPLYCFPAPGFEHRAPNGERLVCKVNVAMQGRIDSTRLFNAELFAILILKCKMHKLLWDRQVAVYHHGPHENSTASLSQILLGIKTAKDSGSQQPPIGYAVIGWHVDDGLGLACSVGWTQDYKSHRVVQFIQGWIEVMYATTLTGWHGNKALGFTLSLSEEDETVTMSASDAIKQLADIVLKGVTAIAPKHIMATDFDEIPSGEVPQEGDPARAEVLAEMTLCRRALGLSIWISNAYAALVMPVGVLCRNMAFPHTRTLKAIRYTTMHLTAHGQGNRFGFKGSFGLEQPDDLDHSDPLGARPMFLHWFSDANLSLGNSRTGGVGMLARGPIATISQSQHLKAPDSHTAEVVGGGTNFSNVVPVNGLLQELHIRRGSITPFYLDSKTTVYVSMSDTAIKKSVWLIRRAAVLEDGVVYKEIKPIHISERDMVADPVTKYLTYPVWNRHMHYLQNRLGPVPPYPGKG